MPIKIETDRKSLESLLQTASLVRDAISATISNCIDYAKECVENGNLEEAKIYLKNAVEGIEILNG